MNKIKEIDKEILSRVNIQDNIFLFDKKDNCKIQVDKELYEMILRYYQDKVMN